MEHADIILIGLTAVLAAGIGAQWLAWRLRLPSIVLLLIAGFVAGPIAGWIDPDALMGELLFPFVSLAVALILFEGGMSLRFHELREAGIAIRNLATVGVVVTWLLASFAATWILKTELDVALVLGALLVVTGPTVVGPLLRYIQPAPRIGAIAKWEGIVTDPIGAVLAVLLFEIVREVNAGGIGRGFEAGAMGLARTIVAGGGIGLAAGVAMCSVIRRRWVADFLESPVLLAMVLLVFTACHLVQHESGLLGVTVMGVVIANRKGVVVRHLIEFKENLRTLLISVLFVLLAARLDANQFSLTDARLWGFVLFLVLVVRPLAVFLSTIGTKLTWRERVLLGWLAPRGIVAAAVASIFAFRFGASGSESGNVVVSATFLTIIVTVVVYGLTAGPLARWLGLATPNPQGLLIGGAHAIAREVAAVLKEVGHRVLLVDQSRANVRRARLAGLEARVGDLVSEHAVDEVDLSGIGRLLAMTSNDEVNSLAALHLSEVFGRDGTFQLVPERERNEESAEQSKALGGRNLFFKDATFRALYERWNQGARIKRTPLTEAFTLDNYREKYADGAKLLFILKKDGTIDPVLAGVDAKAEAGDAVVALVAPEPENGQERSA